MYSNIIVG